MDDSGDSGCRRVPHRSDCRTKVRSPAICIDEHDSWDGPRPYKKFQGSVGLNDVASESKTAVVFRIQGDGKELWKSEPVKALRDGEKFDVDVTGVRELTLLVDCPGDNFGALAEWVEPRLSE
jgi:hypothetical protein